MKLDNIEKNQIFENNDRTYEKNKKTKIIHPKIIYEFTINHFLIELVVFV